MENALRSSVTLAVQKFAAHIGSSPPAASTPAGCDAETIHVKAQWLIRMLAWVRATLDDAEDMDPTDESIRRWLRDLQGVADAAEDVLDEFPQEAMRLGFMGDDAVDRGVGPQHPVGLPRQGKKTKKRKMLDQVRRSSSHTPPDKILAFLCGVEQRIEQIVSRFMKMEKPEEALEREFSNGQIYAETMTARRTTISATKEPFIFGREKDLATVKQFLLSSDAEEFGESGDTNVSVMAIVGMGGLGKTTLAQLAYHDDEVNQHFQLKSWVCVSENFDIIRLTKAMIEPFDQEACHISELDPLHQKLKKILDNKKLLLVLDDVWEVEKVSSNWNLLTAPLHNCSAGSKIIITTRDNNVSITTGRISTYNLPYLEDGDCLKLFNQYAFEGRDPNVSPNLVAIGEKIARNCRGLPLAVKTIGSQLNATDGEDTWNDILKSDAWNNIVQGEDIMPILRLSYQHLPAYLKRCFRYCSVFPKDYEFDRDRLIRMWMAQGYVKVRGRELMEDAGKRYFDDLLSRSFFQYFQDHKKFLMHDLMHDLAISVSRDECCRQMATDGPHLIKSNVQHFSLSVLVYHTRGSLMSLENTSDPQSIASFLLFQTGLAWWFHNIKPLDDLFARMQHLRVLVLNGIPFSKFRGSITHLKHLRYLGFNNSNTALANKEENLVNKRNNNNIVEPPESVRNLCHLQTLELTSLEWHSDGVIYHDLPNWILNLVNLRHLIYDKDYPTVSVGFPVGIGRLTNLRTLPGFLVSKKHDHAKLGELRDMNDIEGTLAITDIDHLTDVDEAKKACLEKKRKLQSLQLKWDSLWGSPSQIDDAVLENLKPCPKLGNLRISSFKGAATPSWLGHPSFSRLTNIELDGCHNWASLPPFGQLPSLLYLSIKSAMSVKSIGREFFSGGFPQLRTLQLKDMQNWKTWDGVREGECPHLRELNIAGCIVLESLSVVNLNALETLRISGCYRIRFPSDEQLPSSLQVFNVKGSAFLPEWCRCHMRSLLRIQQLQVEGLDYHHLVLQNVWCVREAKDFTLKFKQEVQFLELTWDDEPNLVSSANCGPAEEVLENLQPCSNLTELVIRGYNGSMLASWLGDPAFSSLVSVTLHGCRQCKLLPALGLLPRLTKLHIKGAHALRCIGKEFFNGCGRSLGRPAFPYLKRLEFDDMPNWEEWAEMENFDLPYLHELIIKHCPLLQKLPPLPPTLNNIEIEDCNTMIIPSSLNHLILLHTFRISQVPTLHQLPVLPSALKILTVRYLPALANPVMPTSIQDLELQGCNEAFVAASLAHLTHITSLKIIDFPNLMELPLHNLVNLRDLHVSTCPRLQTIDCFYFSHALPEFIEGLQALKSLEHLSVSDCPKLHFSANERLPSALRSMNIFNCPSAASWRDRIWRKQEHRVDSS